MMKMKNEIKKNKVAWVSRHMPLPAQLRTLKEKLGTDVELFFFRDVFRDAKDALLSLQEKAVTHAVVVLPLSMISELLTRAGKHIVWLRAEMPPANGKFNPDTDIVLHSTDENGKPLDRHLRFDRFVILKSVTVITEEL